MTFFKSIDDINIPSVENGQNYIYVILNEPQGNIKIGRTHNPKMRMRALSGSNGGGNHIVLIAISPATYLLKIEEIVHDHFHKYRIPKTEWFDGTKMDFSDAVEYIDGIFNSSSYERLNNLRSQYRYKEKIYGT